MLYPERYKPVQILDSLHGGFPTSHTLTCHNVIAWYLKYYLDYFYEMRWMHFSNLQYRWLYVFFELFHFYSGCGFFMYLLVKQSAVRLYSCEHCFKSFIVFLLLPQHERWQFLNCFPISVVVIAKNRLKRLAISSELIC